MDLMNIRKQKTLLPSLPEWDTTASSLRWCERVFAEGDARRASFKGLSDYYQSWEWECKRLMKFNEAGRKCNRCGATSGLQIIHLSYVRLYNERMEDLEVVCRTCNEESD